jgi:hypothetical protein
VEPEFRPSGTDAIQLAKGPLERQQRTADGTNAREPRNGSETNPFREYHPGSVGQRLVCLGRKSLRLLNSAKVAIQPVEDFLDYVRTAHG